MKIARRVTLAFLLGTALILSGCNMPASPSFTAPTIAIPTSTPTSPALSIPGNENSPTSAPPVLAITATPAGGALIPTQAPTNPAPLEPTSPPQANPQPSSIPNLPEEGILIQEPGPGSTLVSPIRVAGITDPTFEQTLGIRLLLPDGSELGTSTGIVTAGTGQRGPFEAQLSFQITQETPALIQVFSVSPRDGNISHLSSVNVTLTPSGSVDIRPAPTHQEQIAILQPTPDATISGGVVHVEGYGLASFEQHLAVEVQDQTGKVIGSQPVTVQAPDLGQPGFFSVDVPYQASGSGPGRISVHDPSPAFGGDVHVSTVEVQINP